MRKIFLIPLIILIVGVCLALAGFAAGGLPGMWIDRGGVHLEKKELGSLIKVDETYKSYKNIVVNADYFSRVTIKEGDGYAVRGENYERYGGLRAKLNGDTLEIEAKAQRKWFITFGVDELWNDDSTYLEITYPKGAALGDVNVDISASKVGVSGLSCSFLGIDDNFGNVDVSSVGCGGMRINADAGVVSLTGVDVEGDCGIDDNFGDVELDTVSATTLSAKLHSGNLKIRDAAVAGSLRLYNNFGKMTIDGAEADSISMELSSGDLSANDITAGDLTVDNNFGKTTLNRLLFTGDCKIDASSGDVGLKLLMNEENLSYELGTDAGSVTVDGGKFTGSVRNRAPGAGASLTAHCNFGSVSLDFLK